MPTPSPKPIALSYVAPEEYDGSQDPQEFVVVGTAPGGGTVAWDDVTDKPATFAPTIGTTATTAKAGNYTPPNATTAAKGVVNQAAAQANSAATDVAGLLVDFNALLAKLRTAGILAP